MTRRRASLVCFSHPCHFVSSVWLPLTEFDVSATLDTAGGSHYRALLCARDHHLTKTQCDACKAVAKLLRGRVDVAFEPGAARNGKTLDAAQRQLGHDRAENSALRQELSHAHAQAASLSMLPQRAQLLVTDLQTALTKEPNLVGSMSFVQFETVLRKVNAGTIGGPRQRFCTLFA